MTDDDSHEPHKTEAEKKKEEAARRLQEALLRKQQNAPHAERHQQKPGGAFGARNSPLPPRRGPRGG